MEVADGQPTCSGTGKRTIIQDTENGVSPINKR